MLKILGPPERFECKPWQKEDLDYLSSIPNSANWSTMGCFKTSTGLWLAERKVEDVGNVLIVTTKTGKGAFFTAIPRCLHQEDWHVYNVGTRTAEEVLLGDIRIEIDLDELIPVLTQRQQKTLILAHYHCFTRNAAMNEILSTGSISGKIIWDLVLLDEAHKIKSKDVQWTRALKQLAKPARSRHIMTGTGFVNNPAEMWSLVNFLEPKQFSGYWKWRRTFCEEENWSGYDKIVGIKQSMVDDFVKIRKQFGPRRTMQEVHPDIGEPIYNSIEVELNATQKRMYKEIVRDLKALDQQGFAIHSPNVVSQLQRLRQISVATPELVDTFFDPKEQRRVQVVKLVEPSSKLDAVMDLLDGMDLEEKVVIFSSFKDPLELLKTRLDKTNMKYIHLEQKDSDQIRFKKWHDMFPLPEYKIFMSTIALGGESINLACGHYCIFLDRSWSPAQNLQAVGRVYRPGQTGIAEIIHINAKNTVDKKVMDNVNQKVSWFEQLFGDDNAN